MREGGSYRAKWRQKKGKKNGDETGKKRWAGDGEKWDCTPSEKKIRDKTRGRRGRKEERREEKSGVIYASLGTRLYLPSPCELFYIADLIKSNKSQHARTHARPRGLGGSSRREIVNIFSPPPLHPRLNKSRLWCITRRIIHVVYRSKICKQTQVVKVIDAQMGPCSLFGISSLAQHQEPSLPDVRPWLP